MPHPPSRPPRAPAPASRARTAARLARAGATGVLGVFAATGAAALAGCAGASRPAPPPAEFVVAAGDTSLWVRTGPDVGPDGIEVRRAPITLAVVGGRFHELYVTEDDYSFHDALFAAQTVWRRDLLTGDSAVVHGDATAPALAVAYGRRYPHERPLAPAEEGAEEPSVMGVTEAWVVDVHGPFATIETFADVHGEEDEPTHRARLRVVDLRSGAALTVADLLGDSVGASVVARGRAAFAAARDSARTAHASRGDVAQRAAAALGRFAFDERSFTLAAHGAQPGVVFQVPGAGGDAGGHALPLPPIPVPAGAWWREARRAMPEVVEDGRISVARWARGGLVLEAEQAGGEDRLVLRDSTGRAWRLGSVAGGAQRVYWLASGAGAEDGTGAGVATDAAGRAALARAFYEATLYDGTLRAVSHAFAAARPAPRHVTFER